MDRRAGEMSQAMPSIGKTFRRPPTVHISDPKDGFTRLSDSVAPILRCRASPRRALLAENLVQPSQWVFISEIWYKP
jgi:hypothetical protein